MTMVDLNAHKDVILKAAGIKWSPNWDGYVFDHPKTAREAPSVAPASTDAAILAAVTALADEVAREAIAEVVAWLRNDMDDWPDYVAPPDIADELERKFLSEREG